MSITITTDVFCDRCQEWTHGCTGPRRDARTARHMAAGDGWVFVDGLDLCADCAVEEAMSPDLKAAIDSLSEPRS